MRIAIAGGTGTVGRLVTDIVLERGHEPIVLSRSTGIDLLTGDGLDAVLAGVDSVIDVSNTQAMSAAAAIRYFETTTRALLAAEERAGVGHHVALSIVGIDGSEKGYGYYQGKLAQERAVAAGAVPWTLLRATQFHEFAQQMTERMRFGPMIVVPTMRSQPVAAREVAARLVELAAQPPAGRVADLAGPRVERMAELTRRYLRAQGARGRVLEVPLPGAFGRQMRDGSLLAGPDAQVAGPSFVEWLVARTGSDGAEKAAHPVSVAGIPIVRAPLPDAPEPSLSNARQLVGQLQNAGMPITLSITGEERRLPVHVDEVAFRALQEGLSLVLARAGRTEAAATVRYLPHAVEVEVSQGAAAVTPGGPRADELTTSRAAVRRLGGMVASESTPDGGLRLSATIPIGD
jgi:uncharacterized protein YbjT (DUF2867 family)